MLLDKLKFFFIRFISHTLIFSMPMWANLVDIKALWPVMALTYFIFHCFQWFLVGKEVNYRLKIYTRSNSSMDRILERLILGFSVLLIFSNLLSLMSFWYERVIYFSSWIIWLGWISWPTSRKLTERKISYDFAELKFMNVFEKLCLGLIVVYTIFTYPSFPQFNSTDSIKLFFDAREGFHDLFWNFLDMTFLGNNFLGQLDSMYYYVFLYSLMMTFSLSAHYGILRFFFSRTLSLLGTVMFIACWYVSLEVNGQISEVYQASQYIFFIWTILWSLNSSTYRSGLFLGLGLFFCSLINPLMMLPMFPILLYLFYILSKRRSRWYLIQFFKYASFGLALSLLSLLIYHDRFIPGFSPRVISGLNEAMAVVNSKSIFSLAVFGITFYLWDFKKIFFDNRSSKLDEKSLVYVIYILLSIIVAFSFEQHSLRSFSMISIVCFLTLKPLKLIFTKLYSDKSKRNLVFALYLLAILLDSRLEERVKIFMENF